VKLTKSEKANILSHTLKEIHKKSEGDHKKSKWGKDQRIPQNLENS